MKKILLISLSLLFSTQFVFGQSINVIYQSPDTIAGANFEDIYGQVYIQNSSGTTNQYLTEKIELSLVSGHDAYFCWGPSCYPANVFIAPDTVTLAPNEIDSTFYGYLMPYATGTGIDGISIVKYRIYNVNDTSDKFEKIIVYVVGNVSALSHSVVDGAAVYVYPNPASDQLKLVFGEVKGKNGKLIIRNVLGSRVKSQVIDLKSNFSMVNIDQLDNGIYLYSLEIDGVPVITKKFTIRK